jgi:hypothetical protein
MEVVPSLLSAGWASGINAYLTVAVLSLAGRAGVGEVPEALQSDGVLYVSLAMFAIEFVTDKVPYVDNLWDAVHTAVRPAIGSALGFELAGQEGLDGLDEVLAGGGSGALALLSHAVKASLRLGINASPEPVSNIVASLTEDGLVAAVTAFSLENPELAAVLAVVLLVAGVVLVFLIWTRIRRAMGALLTRLGRPPPG